MAKRNFFRKLPLILFNKKVLIFSLILLFASDFLPSNLLEKKSFENFQGILALYFCFNLAFLILRKIKTSIKADRYSILLIPLVLISGGIFYLLWRNENLPEILENFIALLLVACFLVVVIPLIQFIFFLLKKFFLFLHIPKYKKFWVIVFLFALLGVFGFRYYSLEKRVAKLEQVTGYKKILCDEKESIKKVKKSTVRIVGSAAEGSGFFVTSTGFIVTNHHVIAYDPNPKIILPDYSFVQGEVLLTDKRADLAFVKIYGKKDLPTVTFADSDQIEAMEELTSIGYPLGTRLRGEASAVKGRFVALRNDPERNLEWIQTDMSLNSGSSGGPMVNACGEVVAINTVGLAGLGMGISSNDFNRKWAEMAVAEEPLKDVKKVTFNPNGSPKECVEAFYNYQTIGKLEEAYKLLSAEYLNNDSFEQWKEGYKNTLNVVLLRIEQIDENKVYVKFFSTDLKGEDIVRRFFEGIQEVKKIDGQLKLNHSEISEIIKPGWGWFFTLPDWLKP